MNKHTSGLPRALTMKHRRNRRGGLPASTDPLANQAPGSLPGLMNRWLGYKTLCGCSLATIESYRWPLLRLLAWSRTHSPAAGDDLAALLAAPRIERFSFATPALPTCWTTAPISAPSNGNLATPGWTPPPFTPMFQPFDCVMCTLAAIPTETKLSRQHARKILRPERTSAPSKWNRFRQRRFRRNTKLINRLPSHPAFFLIRLYGFRYLDTVAARWLSPDPLGELFGLNLYAVPSNDCVNWLDVLGAAGKPGGSGWRPGPRPQRPGGNQGSGGNRSIPLRKLIGAPASIMTGDAFSDEGGVPAYGNGQCEFLITVTGINMPRDNQVAFNNEVASLPAFKGMPPGAWVHNPSCIDIKPGDGQRGLLDFVQIAIHELTKALTITEMRLVNQIRAAADKARDNGCCCWYIHIVAHSQGTMITRLALDLIDSETKRQMTFTGLGGQTTIGPDSGVANPVNIAEDQDPVPHFWNDRSPWNAGPDPEGFDDPKKTGYDSHSWQDVYLPYLRRNPSRLRHIKHCQ